MNKLILAATLSGALATTAQADTIEISKGIFTDHLGFNEYNEDNDLKAIAYYFDDSKWGLSLAKFKNSYYNDTTAAGVSYNLYKGERFEFEVMGGLMKGYTARDSGKFFCPLKGDYEAVCWYVAPKGTVNLYSYKGATVKASAIILGTALIATVGFSFTF